MIDSMGVIANATWNEEKHCWEVKVVYTDSMGIILNENFLVSTCDELVLPAAITECLGWDSHLAQDDEEWIKKVGD